MMVDLETECDKKSVMPLINFKRGNVPLIIETPHGGSFDVCTIEPISTERICGIDAGTIELAEELTEAITTKSNGWIRPTTITSNVRRDEIDLNRPKKLADWLQPDENKLIKTEREEIIASCLYDAYHDTIEKEINRNIRKFGKSLLISIHGMNEGNMPDGFRGAEIVFGTNNQTSINKDNRKNIRSRFIDKMMHSHIPASPHHPKGREHILTGGYITDNHGKSKLSDAVQLEISQKIRTGNSVLRDAIIDNIADVLLEEVERQ